VGGPCRHPSPGETEIGVSEEVPIDGVLRSAPTPLIKSAQGEKESVEQILLPNITSKNRLNAMPAHAGRLIWELEGGVLTSGKAVRPHVEVVPRKLVWSNRVARRSYRKSSNKNSADWTGGGETSLHKTTADDARGKGKAREEKVDAWIIKTRSRRGADRGGHSPQTKQTMLKMPRHKPADHNDPGIG